MSASRSIKVGIPLTMTAALLLAGCSSAAGGGGSAQSPSALGLGDNGTTSAELPTPVFTLDVAKNNPSWLPEYVFYWVFKRPEGVDSYCQVIHTTGRPYREPRFPCNSHRGVHLDPKESYRFVLWYGPQGDRPELTGNLLPGRGYTEYAWEWENGKVVPPPYAPNQKEQEQ